MERATAAKTWHALDQAAALTAAGAARAGLDSAEARARLKSFGPNAIPQGPERTIWHVIWAQTRNVMTVVLAAAALLAGMLGDWVDTGAILAILVLNIVVGTIQEARAERALRALRALNAPRTRVWRSGLLETVDAADLVPGDVVALDSGDRVPADLRILQSVEAQFEEAILTGESLPVIKNPDASVAADAALGDRVTMAFAGTMLMAGRATGLVVATGRATELGRIAALLAKAEPPQSPLERKLAALAMNLAGLVIVVAVIILVLGLWRGDPWQIIVLTAVSLGVAAIPESLPAVVTIVLAVGALRMARENAVVRRLAAIESLGAVTHICTDKTGTLTQNRLQLTTVKPMGAAGLGHVHQALALCNDAEPASNAATFQGDPLDVALLQAVKAAGADIEAIRSSAARLLELPFDSTRKYMASLHQGAHGFLALMKGAPEAVATHLDLDMAARLDLLSEAEAMAANGLKVLCLAEAHAVDDPSTPFLNGRLGYAPLALLGFQDPPRAEAADAVAQCQSAGIVPIMITGDHAETARAIAGQLGMLGRDLDAPDLVITGPQMAQLSRADLIHRLGSARVFARVDPEQKIDIVRALRQRGAIMAMTGDGVNDAPAISAADIGIAMGKGGSDVAKEASAIVLADDNFATIVKAIREGRRISDNIARFVSYILTCNVSEVLVLALALLAGLPLPLTPLQILWINLVTDGIPGLALASERAEANVMRRPPDRPHAPIVTRALMLRVAWMSSVMAVLVLAVQVWEMQEPGAPWQSMVFTALVAVQLAYALSLRSNERPVWETGILSNPLLLGALVVTLGLQLLIIYLPVLNAVFETAPLSWGHLGLALGCGLVVLIAAEAA
ncbi:MAG TPA: ATPase, partial [Alphaproteobacteria bacterium]|nr:ATPase [Alphaproteobacteria bacterium]